MSALILDDALVEQMAREIHTRALQYPNSVAADILPLHFQAVVQGVAMTIDLEFEDRDASLWASLGRLKASNPQYFRRRRSNPGQASLAQFFSERKTSA